jgi:outer membrane protein TolC
MAALMAGAALAGDPDTMPRPLDEVLGEYVATGLASNLALQQHDLGYERSVEALKEARGRFLPSIALESRFSRNDGGRTLDFPVGDLLNPVYATLNELTAGGANPTSFPPVANQKISFLREQEQQSAIRLTQPVYVPQILANLKLQTAQSAAERAARDAYSCVLTRDVRTAYYGWMRAQQALGIVEASIELLNENLRASQSLFNNGKVTEDQVLRAKAELLAAEQQRLEAANGVRQAQSYFNFLLNRPLGTEIERAAMPASLKADLPAIEGLQTQAQSRRAELRQLEQSELAAQASIAAARAEFKPTLAVTAELGSQGEEYRFTSEERYTTAALVFSWNVFNGNQSHARLAAARLDARNAQAAREEIAQRIALEVQQSHDNLLSSASALDTAEARLQAAAAAFRIATRKRDAGVISQVEFLDARSTLTDAELNRNLTQFELLTAKAELDFAVGIAPGSAAPEPSS